MYPWPQTESQQVFHEFYAVLMCLSQIKDMNMSAEWHAGGLSQILGHIKVLNYLRINTLTADVFIKL